MKQKISRLSPHQNAKVAAVLSAVASLIFVVPIYLLGSFAGAETKGMPMWLTCILPVFYLIVMFITTVIACALYNVIVPMTGGIEHDASPGAA